jgi:hypothetical protein
VQVLDNPYHDPKDKILGKLKFETDRPLYLYQLAILAVTLHESDTCYRLFSKNCYWFAGLLVDVLKVDYKLQFIGNGERRGGPQSGTWNHIPVFKEAPETAVNEIICECIKRVGVFEETVCSRLATLTTTERSVRLRVNGSGWAAKQGKKQKRGSAD